MWPLPFLFRRRPLQCVACQRHEGRVEKSRAPESQEIGSNPRPDVKRGRSQRGPPTRGSCKEKAPEPRRGRNKRAGPDNKRPMQQRTTATRGRRQLPVRGGKRGDKEGAGPAGRHGRESDSGAHEQPEHGTCSGEFLSHVAASVVTWRPFRGRPTGRASSLYPAFLALAGLSRT